MKNKRIRLILTILALLLVVIAWGVSRKPAAALKKPVRLRQKELIYVFNQLPWNY